MYLADCHNHSCCSADSQAPLQEMAQAAAQMGLAELCTTDHLDLIGRGGLVRESWDWKPVLDQYEQAKAACPKGLELRLGLELGSAQFFPERARQMVDGVPLDMVLGSAHNTSPERGGLDYIEFQYTDEDMCHRMLEGYFDSLLTLADMDVIDVLAHLPYVLRYMNDRDGNRITLERHRDQIDRILTKLIQRGAGLEFNTNRNRGGMVERWRPILERYRQRGGEIVTLGSDAHWPEHVGLGIPEGAQLLRDVGYRYYAVYRQRKPEFIPL